MIELQKMQQKFDALFEDENIVAEFEKWLEDRNVKPVLQQTPCTALLPDECKHEKSYYCFKTGGGRCRKCQKLTGQ